MKKIMAFIPKFEGERIKSKEKIKIEINYDNEKEDIFVSANEENIEKIVQKHVVASHPEHKEVPIVLITQQTPRKL